MESEANARMRGGNPADRRKPLGRSGKPPKGYADRQDNW